MRRVSVDYNNNENLVTLYIFYDKPLSQDELDSDIPGTIITEMSCDFPQELNWNEEVVVLPYPKKIPDTGLCVFQRYEPTPEF